jgi:hypothetical protein
MHSYLVGCLAELHPASAFTLAGNTYLLANLPKLAIFLPFLLVFCCYSGAERL